MQETFDKIFSVLDIRLKTCGNWNWEIYLEYNRTIDQVRSYLEQKLNCKVTLIDAHSFLYKMSYIDYSPNSISKKRNSSQSTDDSISTKLEYTNKKETKSDLVTQDEFRNNTLITPEYFIKTSEDFLSIYQKQMENGRRAEEIVYNYEKNKLISIGREDLAMAVEFVGEKIGLGFDILSFESIVGTEKIEKQIEVKSTQSNHKFYLTQNENNKSKTLSNFHLYLVEKINSETPTIIEIRHPDFSNKNDFERYVSVYEITYKANQK